MHKVFFVLASIILAASATAQSIPAARPVAPTNGFANGPIIAAVDPAVMEQLLENRTPIDLPKDLQDIETTIIFEAMIDETGHVMHLNAISGDLMLRQYVMQAVRQWSYRPFLLNGRPTKVSTRIIVQIKKQSSD